MPKIALISDIHSNFEALNKVYISIVKMKDVKHICCLGDLVGYGPNPNEVVAGMAQIEKKGFDITFLLGNHDASALGMIEFVNVADPEDQKMLAAAGLHSEKEIGEAFHDRRRRKYLPVKPDAKRSAVWTREKLSPKWVDFLKERARETHAIKAGVMCAHGSLRDPAYEYIRDETTAAKNFESPQMKDALLCFIGHTHAPATYTISEEDRMTYAGNTILTGEPKVSSAAALKLSLKTMRYIVNVGAVGQPRDGDPRASFAIYDSDEETVQIIRVDYEVEKTKSKIVSAGLPKELAERLGGTTEPL